MERTNNLWTAVEEKGILVTRPVNGYDNAVLVDQHEDVDDGTFPRVADWTRTVNQIEDSGIQAWINRWTRKRSKLEIDLGEFKIIRESADSAEATLHFKEPITVWLAKIGETNITSPVTKIKGEFFHDYYFIKGGRQDKIANGFEVWFSIKEYLA